MANGEWRMANGEWQGAMMVESKVENQPSGSLVARGVRLLKPVFLILALVFVGLLLANQWNDLRNQIWRLHGGWLTAAILGLLVTWAAEIGLWRLLLRLIDGPLDGRLDFGAAARIWFASAIVRYIPGNVWQPLSMTVLCRERGIRAEATLISVVLIQVITLLGVLPLAAVYLLFTGNLGMLSAGMTGAIPWLAGLALGCVLLFLLRPGWLFGLLNWLLVKVGRPALPISFSSPRLLGLLVIGMGIWILWGLTFAAVTFAVVDLPPAQMGTDLFHLVGTYPMAYAMGYLSFITPSGLGVREGALFFWLEPVIGGGVATLAALAMRLLTTAGELVLAGLGALWGRKEKEKAKGKGQKAKGKSVSL